MRKYYLNVHSVTFPDLDKRRYIKYQDPHNQYPRYLIRCDERIKDGLGRICYCNMKPQRADRFKNWFMKNGHTCFPGEPVNQKTLEETIEKNPKQKLDDITEEAIHRCIAEFTGKKNLSLEVLSSQDFYDLSCKLIAFGLASKKDQYPIENAHMLYHPLKRDKLRLYLIDEAIKKHKEMIKKFADLPYSCISLDEGTTSKYQNLHAILENPNEYLQSYPFATLRMHGGRAKHYVETISHLFSLISATGIKIGSVVCDGNTAQKKAFSFSWDKSLRFKTIDDIKKIIYVPCLCHRINNAYKSQVLKNSEINNIVNLLHEIEDECRQNPDLFKKACPSHCPTRWIYDYEIVCFVTENSKVIQDNFPQYKQISFEPFEHLKKCLIIYRTLISLFETPKTKFQYAFIYLERGINALLELSREEHNLYASSLAYSLQNYTLLSNDAGLWCLAYIFTAKGRKDLRARSIKECNPYASGYLKYFDFEKSYEDDSNIDITSLSLEEVIMTVDGEDISFEDDDESDDDFNEESFIEDDEEDDDFFSDSEDEYFIKKAKPFKDYRQCAKQKLKEILNHWELSKDDITIIVRKFNEYIDASEEELEDYKTSDNDYSWVQVRFEVEGFREIADIALRLLSSAVSEACCERTIKIQRLIHNERRLRSEKLLLDARLILSSV